MCAYVLGGMGQALIFSFLPKLYQILLKLQKNKIKKQQKAQGSHLLVFKK